MFDDLKEIHVLDDDEFHQVTPSPDESEGRATAVDPAAEGQISTENCDRSSTPPTAVTASPASASAATTTTTTGHVLTEPISIIVSSQDDGDDESSRRIIASMKALFGQWMAPVQQQLNLLRQETRDEFSRLRRVTVTHEGVLAAVAAAMSHRSPASAQTVTSGVQTSRSPSTDGMPSMSSTRRPLYVSLTHAVAAETAADSEATTEWVAVGAQMAEESSEPTPAMESAETRTETPATSAAASTSAAETPAAVPTPEVTVEATTAAAAVRAATTSPSVAAFYSTAYRRVKALLRAAADNQLRPYRGKDDHRTVPEFMREFDFVYGRLAGDACRWRAVTGRRVRPNVAAPPSDVGDVVDADGSQAFRAEAFRFSIDREKCPWVVCMPADASMGELCGELFDRYWTEEVRETLLVEWRNSEYDPLRHTLRDYVTVWGQRLLDLGKSRDDVRGMVRSHLPVEVACNLDEFRIDEWLL